MIAANDPHHAANDNPPKLRFKPVPAPLRLAGKPSGMRLAADMSELFEWQMWNL